jgi:hypothetical protein
MDLALGARADRERRERITRAVQADRGPVEL